MLWITDKPDCDNSQSIQSNDSGKNQDTPDNDFSTDSISSDSSVCRNIKNLSTFVNLFKSNKDKLTSPKSQFLVSPKNPIWLRS